MQINPARLTGHKSEMKYLTLTWQQSDLWMHAGVSCILIDRESVKIQLVIEESDRKA